MHFLQCTFIIFIPLFAFSLHKKCINEGYTETERERERANMCGRLVHTYIPRYSMCFYMSERQRGSKLNFVCDLLFGFEVYFPFITAIKWVCVWVCVCGSWKEKEYDDVVVVMATRVWQCAYAVLNVHKLVFFYYFAMTRCNNGCTSTQSCIFTGFFLSCALLLLMLLSGLYTAFV